VNPNRQNAEAGMFSNDADAPQPSEYGGGDREQGIGPQDPNLDVGAGGGRMGGVSAGYDNNIESEGGGGGGPKKHGLLSKVKEVFAPKPGSLGRTGNEGLVS
jgi:hypothetical protein